MKMKGMVANTWPTFPQALIDTTSLSNGERKI
jgi:hypothetical protein